MNSRPIDLALLLGIGDALEFAEELVHGVDGEELRAGGGDEVTLHLLAFARPQQSVVDEHARQSVADGTIHQGGGDRGVDAAGEPADRVTVADLGAYLFDEDVGDIGGGPGRGDAGDVVQEAAEHLLAVRRVQHLGVVLDTGEAALRVLERRNRRARTGAGDLEPVRGIGDCVAVAHPDRLQRGSPPCRMPPSTLSSVRPYSRVPVFETVPPSACAIAWKP